MRNTHAYIHTYLCGIYTYIWNAYIHASETFIRINWNTHASTYLYKCFKCMNTFFSYMYVCSYMRMCKRFTCSIHTSNFSSDGESVSIVNVRVFHRYVCMKFQGQGRHLNRKAGTKSAFLNSQSAPIWVTLFTVGLDWLKCHALHRWLMPLFHRTCSSTRHDTTRHDSTRLDSARLFCVSTAKTWYLVPEVAAFSSTASL